MNLFIGMFAVLIMLVGGGVVAVTYYSTKVVLPEQVPLPVGTTIFASNGKDQLAKLGKESRVVVPIEQIPKHVRDAVAAAEDRNFYKHKGVDYVGIGRAAWNNLTGGTKQGASTITQQYARNAYKNLKDDTYSRKVKEAMLASKLNDKYDKNTIMQHYLNTIYFGRGAYGIEVAALTYFGKNASKLDVAEAAVLAAVIKQPITDPQSGVLGFDPADNLPGATDRWNYVLTGMVEEGFLKAAERPTAYPKVLKKTTAAASVGVNTPKGNVINYVKDEMATMGLCLNSEPPADSKLLECGDALGQNGYRITTTIDINKQNAAEAAARKTAKNSVLSDQPSNLQAAVVSIDPRNGRVLAYYGGDDGTKIDFAGKNILGGKLTGGRPPGSSFKVYTLAAAINAGISIQSHWSAKPFKPKGIKNPIQNAERDASCDEWCTLEESTIQSYNVPFYHISEEIGADKIVDMAKQAGISTMWNDKAEPRDLTTIDPKTVAPKEFFHVVAFGQYAITVLDHANGLATLANKGTYNKAHFVMQVQQQDKETGEWRTVGGEHLKPQKNRIRPEVTDEVTSVLKRIPDANNHELAGDREAAGKTGTWQYGETSDNADAWMVGYTREVATAVWIGSKDTAKPKIFMAGGKRDVTGGSLPADIWKRYMDAALRGVAKQDLPNAKGLGNPDRGNGKKPETPVCQVPVLNGLCPFPGTDPNAPPNAGGPNVPNDPNTGGGGPGGGGPGGGGPGGGGGPRGGGGGGGGGVAILPTTAGTRD